jgi:hypothetical protein
MTRAQCERSNGLAWVFRQPALYRSIRYRLDRRQLAGENGDGADVRLRKGGEQVELPMSKPSARRACRLGRFGNDAHPRSGQSRPGIGGLVAPEAGGAGERNATKLSAATREADARLQRLTS